MLLACCWTHFLLQETITDSESENEPKPPSLKRKVNLNTKTDNGEVQATGGIAIQIHYLTDCGRRNSAALIQKQSPPRPTPKSARTPCHLSRLHTWGQNATFRPLRSQRCAWTRYSLHSLSPLSTLVRAIRMRIGPTDRQGSPRHRVEWLTTRYIYHNFL